MTIQLTDEQADFLWADLDEMIEQWDYEEFLSETWPAMVAAMAEDTNS